MIFQTIPPPKHLSPYIKGYWMIEFEVGSAEAISFRLGADAFPNLVFIYKDPIWEQPANGEEYQSPTSHLAGQRSSYSEMKLKGHLGLLGVYFHSKGLKELLGIPPSEIREQLFDIKLILGQKADQLESQILEAKDNVQRIHILNRFFSDLMKGTSEEDLPIQYFSNLIFQSKGLIDLRDLHKKAFMSRRTFERKFMESVGLSPQLFARVVRFQNAIKNPAKRLIDIALDSGYYDHSHFIRDFKKFSGSSPKEYFNIEEGRWDIFYKKRAQ